MRLASTAPFTVAIICASLSVGRAGLGERWRRGQGSNAASDLLTRRGGRGRAGDLRREHFVMGRDLEREALHQRAELGDLRGGGIVADRARRRIDAVLHGREAAAEFGDLAGKIADAARQVGDLHADFAAVAQPHRDGVEQGEKDECGERDDRGFGEAEAADIIKRDAERDSDHHHADGDEDRGDANHAWPCPRRAGC